MSFHPLVLKVNEGHIGPWLKVLIRKITDKILVFSRTNNLEGVYY